MKNITYLFLILSIISEGAVLMASQPQELSQSTKELFAVLAQSSQESPELIESIKQLLSNGANLNATDNDDDTPLQVAAIFCHTEVCKLLIQEHANVNATSNYGSTALHRAAESGHTVVCKLLIEKQANVNATDNDDDTPLQVAAIFGHTEVCKLFIQEHANVNATSNDGFTALLWAANFGYTEVCKLLIQEHANVNATNNDGSSPLHVAANFGHTEVCELLIQKQANVNATNNDGDTALHRAEENSHTETALLLIPKTVLIRTEAPSNEAASSNRLISTLCLCRRIGLPKDIGFYILQYLEGDVIKCAMPYLRRKLAAQECIIIPASLIPLFTRYLYKHTIESVKSITGLAKILATKNINLDMPGELFGQAIRDNISQLLTPPARVTVLDE
jgi:ankyrin repeat protein